MSDKEEESFTDEDDENYEDEQTTTDVTPSYMSDDLERVSFYDNIFQKAKESTVEGDFLAAIEQQDEVRPEELQKFTDFERLACIGIFNEMIDKLAIIGADKPKAKPHCNFHPPKIRYHEKINKRIYDIDTTAVVDEGIMRTNKFQRERTLLELILKLTRDELYENSSIEALSHYLHLEENKMKEEYAIISTHEKYSQTINLLKNISEESEQHTKHVLKEQTELSNKIEGELQECMFHYGIKLGFCRKWHEARLEQNTMKIQMEEEIVNNELDEARKKISNEERVHKDIVLYLNMSILKLNKDIDSWRRRYELDTTSKDNEIFDMRTKKSDEADKMRSMLNTYMKRREEINNYLAEKAERIKAEKLRKERAEAAIRIQAWWRGTMVRWKLGEYADKKKKKKGKEKGKEKPKKT